MRSSAPAFERQPATAELKGDSWLLLLSTYALITSAALLLSVTETVFGYAFAAAALCAGHALICGPGGRPLLSSRGIQIAGVVALVASVAHAQWTSIHISYASGHFLIMVQLIMLYGERRLRRMRVIEATAILQFLIAGIWALELLYMPFFLLAALCLLANMATVEMHRATDAETAPATAGPADLLAALWLPLMGVLLCTGVGFVLLPRASWAGRPHRPLGRLMTGFSENVSLREIGALRKSERLAFEVKFLKPEEQRIKGEDEGTHVPPRLLMRGTALPGYGNGEWYGYGVAIQRILRRGPKERSGPRQLFSSRDIYELKELETSYERVIQKVRLARHPDEVLFSLYRAVRIAGAPPYSLTVHPFSHQVDVTTRAKHQRRYEIVSKVPQLTPEQLREAGTPSPIAPWHVLWETPDHLRLVLQRVAERIEELYQPTNDYDRLMAAERYLSDEQLFAYSLELPDYGTRDPVAAFLTDTRRGSCEHFASALALIGRVWDIPTRLAIGYKEGELNPNTQTYQFRDSDAHAWVEAYFNDVGWVQFDPTPWVSGSGKKVTSWGIVDTVSAEVDSWVRVAGSWLSETWESDIIGYNRAQQKELLDGLIAGAKSLANDLSRAFGVVAPLLPDAAWLQLLLAVVALTGLVMLLHVGASWLQAHLPGRRGRRQKTLRFYEDLLRILRKKGIDRAPSATPRELARVASRKLGRANGDAPAVRSAIQLVTDIYCRTRFGRQDLDEEQQEAIRAALRELKGAKPLGPA